MSAELARIGGVLAAAGLAAIIVSPTRSLRLAGLAAWAIGGAWLAAYLAPVEDGQLLVAGAVGGSVAAVAGAIVLRRWAWLLPLGVLALAPARIPVTVGDENANLLIPLYGLVAAAALAFAYDVARGNGRTRELGPLAWPLAAFVAWSGVSLAWSDDLREGSIFLLFFVLPFGLLAVALARVPWSRRLALSLYGLLTAMAVVFAAIGVYQWATREVFWNPKVEVGNAYAPSAWFYRVNSIFYDPSIYGRFLVIAILASLVVAVAGTTARRLAALAAAVVAIWIGLLPSFSQSSFVSLIAATMLAAALVWRWRAAATVGLVVLVAVSVGFSAPQVRDRVSGSSFDRLTSGRGNLLTNGVEIALDNPVLGVGVGSFKQAYAERVGLRGREPRRGASHTTPVTVAAETGAPGLALFLWLLAAAFFVTLRRMRPTIETRTLFIAGIALAAITVHSLFYDAFFEDPMMWGLLGLAALASFARRETEAT